MRQANVIEATDSSGQINALWTDLYPELKKIARARLRRSGPNTVLDTTSLVNDAYLRVAGAAALRDAAPGQFLAYAARAMRSVVIDLLRERRALRHGGGLQRMTLNTTIVESLEANDEPQAIDDALTELAAVEPRLSQVVEMRYFGCFTDSEIGVAMGVSERTVRRDWDKARLLIRTMLTE
jgi:RNA polymerase sigma factor (TIGR02999 family)